MKQKQRKEMVLLWK